MRTYIKGKYLKRWKNCTCLRSAYDSNTDTQESVFITLPPFTVMTDRQVVCCYSNRKKKLNTATH